MKNALRGVGTFVIIFGVIGGFFTGSILKFFAVVIAAVVNSLIYFTLATLLENQEIIMHHVGSLDDSGSNSLLKPALHTCIQCGKKYDADRTSCPYCGCKDTL